MNILHKFIIGTSIVGSFWGAYSCNDDNKLKNGTVQTRLENYMAEKPYSELVSIQKSSRPLTRGADLQASLDSVAYRDIFNSTNAAKDSKVVEEFNKIAAKMKIDKPNRMFYRADLEVLSDKIRASKTSPKEYQSIINEMFQAKEKTVFLQYKVDSIAYNRFFQKHGLINDSILKKISVVVKKIRP